MKKSTKIFFLILLILIIGIFVHPQKVIYEANVNGKVVDENNKPVINATVYRIEKEYYINEEIGSNESRDLRTESVKTDKNGKVSRETNFPNKEFSSISHVRPHAKDASDTYSLPKKDKLTKENEYTKHCFWLNNRYVRDEIYLKK